MIKRLLCLAVQRAVAREMREGDCKNLLYATFVKTVTATRWLERMFPIHALYRLITGRTFCTAEHIARNKNVQSCASVLPLCKVGGSSARYLSCTSLLVFYWTLQVLSPPLSHHHPPSTLAAILTNFLHFHPLLLCLLYRSHASLPSLRNAIAKNGFFLNRFLVRLPEARGEQWTN